MKKILELEQLQKILEKKAKKRQKKQRPKMIVSGRSVLKLRRLIIKKAKNS